MTKRIGSAKTRAAAWFTAASVAAVAGCGDSRMSVREFIELQEQYSRPPSLTSVDVTPTAVAVANQPLPEPAAAAAPVHPVARLADDSTRPYRVGPSDVLAVSLFGLNEDGTATTVMARINRDGEIVLPIVGAIKVAEMEIEDVERAILDTYVPAFVKSMSVNVTVAAYDVTSVLVVGAASAPGLTQLRRTDRTVLHAVAAAAGFSQQASGRVTLKRMRRPAEEVTLNLRDPVELEAALSLAPLESGDIVTVEAAPPNTLFVGGLVNAPGPQLLPPGTTLNALQALSAAGGVIEDVGPTEATLTRRMPDGTDRQARIDLNRLRCGKEPNIDLKAGDILWVPETFGTKVAAFINRSIFFRAGATASYNVVGNASGVEYLNRTSQQSGGGQKGGTTLQNLVDPLGFLAPPQLP